jgi:UPF0176 protein
MTEYKIITFYEFRRYEPGVLPEIHAKLKARMRELSVKGTVILATEGFNATVCGSASEIDEFISSAEELLGTGLEYSETTHDRIPFRRSEVKIKPEIVTLREKVVHSRGAGTHVEPSDWNRIITGRETYVLDARNDYEFRTGTFRGAVNPGTESFSQLPEFVKRKLDPAKHKRIAMFCTGGIRCEKLAPYLKQLGYDEIYHLRGGILNYLDKVKPGDSLWEGECFVFDDRISLDGALTKGRSSDLSPEASTRSQIE